MAYERGTYGLTWDKPNKFAAGEPKSHHGRLILGGVIGVAVIAMTAKAILGPKIDRHIRASARDYVRRNG